MEELRAENIVKNFGKNTVVNNVSLKVNKGEVVGLLGANGAGKTTTFHIILGALKSEKGRIFLDKEDITSLPMYMRARKGIGFLPQEPSAFRGLTAMENLRAVAETMYSTNTEIRRAVENSLKNMGLEKVANTKAYNLSGGERRRLEIARALLLSPYFLLLDEPFTGIDPIAVREIQNIILTLKNKGIGILLTDHNVRDTLKITDRAYIIHKGVILKSGTPIELASDYNVRKSYLGEKFSLN